MKKYSDSRAQYHMQIHNINGTWANPRSPRRQRQTPGITLSAWGSTNKYAHIRTVRCICIHIFIHQPLRDTWQTDLVEVQPVWLEVRLLLDLFWVIFLPTTPISDFLTQLSTPLTPFQDSSEGTHPKEAAASWTTVTRPVCQPELKSQLPSKYLTLSLAKRIR